MKDWLEMKKGQVGLARKGSDQGTMVHILVD